MSKKLENSSKNRFLLISAFGIHVGGGMVLLRALLHATKNLSKSVLLDERYDLSFKGDGITDIHRVPKNLWSRLKAQSRIAIYAKSNDLLLLFNSLPPLFRSRAYVINFVHAPHFVGAHTGVRYTPLTRFRLKIERLWFRIGIHNCDEIWVQTESMYLAMKGIYPKANLRVIPLVDDKLINVYAHKKQKIRDVDASQYSFFYPADAVGHKNHVRLIDAWRKLAEKGLRPNLLLTLQPADLKFNLAKLGMADSEYPQIKNLGPLNRDSVLNELKNSTALIFPSLAETFGIPMLEAVMLQKPIIASERDFVRDVCAPIQSFDPESSRSIANAVLRFMTDDADPDIKIYSAVQFVEELISSRLSHA